MKKFLVTLALSILVFSAISYFDKQKLVLAPATNKTKTITNNSSKIPTSSENETESTKPVRLLFVGDTMLSRKIGEQIKNGINPFEHVNARFAQYDLIIANLETTVSTTNTRAQGKYYTFQAPIESAKTLFNNNIKAVSLANNHTKDFQEAGLLETFQYLNESQVKYFGAGKTPTEAFSPIIITLEQLKIGLIGYNEIENRFTVNKSGPTSAWYDIVELKKQIELAKTQSDFVFILPHTGTEYQKSENSWQKKTFKNLIDTGADMIIGNHPHVTQGKEVYNNKYIYYSLGNFVFDGMNNIANATDGLCVEVVIEDKKISQVNELPIKIGMNGFPEFIN